VAEDDCSFETMTREEVVKRNIKSKFGIEMSDEGGKNWDVKNLRLVYSSLQNINNALNGNLKSLVGEATFKLAEYTGEGCPKGKICTYGGSTSGSTITFSTTGNDLIHQMNLYHEFGHVLNNLPGHDNEFSDALKNYDHRSFINSEGKLDSSALITGLVNDPNYGPHVEAIQHPSTDPKEQWADIFANYVAGNIDLSKPTGPGADMNSFITGILP
jgi:hypothetical protein